MLFSVCRPCHRVIASSIRLPKLMARIMKISVICFLLLWISTSNASQDGASQTSCYSQVILHKTFGMFFSVNSCTSNILCSNVNLAVSCPEQDDMICCRDFNSGPIPTLYTYCNYMCKLNYI